MNHVVLWCLTSKSFCKDTNKVCNLQTFELFLTFTYQVVCPYINELLTEVPCEHL